MKQYSKILLASMLAYVLAFPLVMPVRADDHSPSVQSFVGGKFVARNYAYNGVRIFSGNNNAGAATITLSSGSIALPDGRNIVPFSAGGVNILGQPGPFPAIPITVGAGTVKETVTPTAMSGCFKGAPQGTCTITATFANAHGQGELVTSGSGGIQEAINDAGFFGGGVVSVDPSEAFYLGGVQTARTAMAAALPVQGVSLEEDITGPPTFWSPVAGSTTLAAPSTLTATTVGFGLNGANTTGGTYVGANTYFACVAYVDIYGQEGPCSASFSGLTAGTGSTNQIGFSAPAASAGAVGYTIYISLTSGSYNLSYKVPLVTQPTVVGAYPVSNGVCVLTSVETATPACAVANTTYGQLGVSAAVSALTLNTSPITPQVTVISTTAVYVPNAGGRTTYTYAPSGNVGAGGFIPTSWLPFTIAAAAATIVPAVVGTINLPPNFMNVLGKKIEICGEMTTTASVATIVDVQFQWDAIGQNTAGKGVLIGDATATPTVLVTAGHATFCQDFMTTVTSASATGGTINHVNTYGGVGGLTLVGTGALADAMTAATNGGTGSLNLADAARINIIYLHTSSTDGAGWTLQNVTVKQI